MPMEPSVFDVGGCAPENEGCWKICTSVHYIYIYVTSIRQGGHEKVSIIWDMPELRLWHRCGTRQSDCMLILVSIVTNLRTVQYISASFPLNTQPSNIRRWTIFVLPWPPVAEARPIWDDWSTCGPLISHVHQKSIIKNSWRGWCSSWNPRQTKTQLIYSYSAG